MNAIEEEPEIIFLKDLLLVYYTPKSSIEELNLIQNELKNIKDLGDLNLIKPGHNLYPFVIHALAYVESDEFKFSHDDNFLNYVYHMILRLKHFNTNVF